MYQSSGKWYNVWITWELYKSTVMCKKQNRKISELNFWSERHARLYLTKFILENNLKTFENKSDSKTVVNFDAVNMKLLQCPFLNNSSRNDSTGTFGVEITKHSDSKHSTIWSSKNVKPLKLKNFASNSESYDTLYCSPFNVNLKWKIILMSSHSLMKHAL